MEEIPNKVKLEVYKEDAVINVALPVKYVFRFNELLMNFIPFKDQEHMLKTLEDISNNKIEDEFSYHVATILAFLTLVEDSARDQNLLKKVEYDRTTNEKIDIEE